MERISPPQPAVVLARARRLATALVAATAVVVFVGGWVLGEDALKNLVPGTVVMKAPTALGLLWLAVGLALLGRRPGLRRVAQGFGAAAALLGTVVGLEYVTGRTWWVDEGLFRDDVGHRLGVAHPGRFAPTTALCLVLVGAVIVLLGRRRRTSPRLVEHLVLPVIAISGITLVGYLYSIPTFYGPASAAKMALVTGLCFLALGFAAVATVPGSRLVVLAAADDPGALLIRRLLPVAIGVPLGLGWLRLQAVESGVFGDRVGTWWLAAVTALGLALVVLRIAARLSAAAAVQRRLEAELVHLADHDVLTGLCSRRRFDDELARHLARADRSPRVATVVSLDLDRLKVVNDTLGHEAGDRLLEGVGRAIAGRIRAGDLAGRLGGDEFALLLEDTDVADALVLAEDLRARIAGNRPGGDLAGTWSTVSIGIARVTDDARTTMALADDAMYRAKRAGGNRVEVASPAPLPA